MAGSWIAFHLTDRCQLDCQHCLRDPGLTPKDLPLDIIRKALAEARSVYGTTHVALTGGEPTLYPEFPQVLDAIVEHGLTWHVVTNAKRLEATVAMLKAVPARKKSLTAINISTDGADEATHDAIRGKGSFREVMMGATLCTAHQIPFTLQMVVNARNVGQIEAFGLLGAQLGAARVSFGFLQATGTHFDRQLFLPARVWRSVKERVLRLAATLKIEVAMAEGFPEDQPFHVCKAWSSEHLHVDVEGRLTMCCQHADVPGDGTRSDVGGSLREMSLVEAHRRVLAIVHEAQSSRLERLGSGPRSEWDDFPCNDCLAHFGRPHWEGETVAGPEAERQRWRGAWAKVRLRVVG
jgi:MoaA/NifB/PqqE/SkfB family radical SAM enzyme